ncbi:MazG nucleotide pyrophosphohydrolase domain-containing protein [Natrarchaeobius sp. A-rgal3]|uniref:MazG nucleotide pyrophosphohydrolase domain-containing protein n=1 Tax=Natrarchaeobius versutus TaxID=1679078 RepID=UPI00350F483A
MDEQQKVAEFMEEFNFENAPEYQLLDLVSEVGELASDATKSTDWGAEPDEIDVACDELGDAFFSLLVVAESFDIDAAEALDKSLEKYRNRIDDPDSPYTGNGYSEQ